MPVLGICVGMQMLAASSDEGNLRGLGWIAGEVRKLDAARAALRLPHMGWNDVAPVAQSRLFAGLERDARFYFLHSYYFACAEAGNALARTDYGSAFACAVRAGNIYGVQFHPEKSHHFGVRCCRTSRSCSMLRPRIIPCLLVRDKGLVKTVGFETGKYVGDPINAVKIFNEKEVDELIVLDIDATVRRDEPDFALIAKFAVECRMPLCYGGGVKTTEQAKRIIGLGVEKVAISSAAVENPR